MIPKTELADTHVLVADDEDSIRWVLTRACTQAGYRVTAVATAAEAAAALRAGDIDIALVDIRMPDGSGLDVLSDAVADRIDTLLIIMTAQNTMANAIEATKRGAYDYLTKPFELDHVHALLQRASHLRQLTRDIAALRREQASDETLVGRTPPMQEVFKVIGRAAPTDATVLVHGETGTGKELVARTIHAHSGRRGAFVALNCSAIPTELLESELFGHERGAFTGATERRLGKFEAAHGGTLLLDEIGDMPSALQAKLLRVLQEREFTRVGGRDTLKADVRVVAATNHDLAAAVRDGRFREDLYFRLNVIRIVIPPLRERRADIPELVRFFVDKVNRRIGTDIVGITDAAQDLLSAHAWPGNVRELENTIVRAAVLARGRTITPDDLGLTPVTTSDAVDALPLTAAVEARLATLLATSPRQLHASIIETVERVLLAGVLAHTNGNQVKAAELLGINRNTLRKKLTDLGIPVDRTGDGT